MSIRNWDLLHEVASLRDTVACLMEDSIVPVPSQVTKVVRGNKIPLRLPLDAYATDDEVVIIASVPGIDPEDVEITLEDDNLTIKGTYAPALENVDYLIHERASGEFSRTVVINVPVEVEKAEAKFEQGVLTLILPKAQEVRPKVIKVQ